MCDKETELCESCKVNEAGEVSTCPLQEAKFVDSSQSVKTCNCCSECYAKCKERS